MQEDEWHFDVIWVPINIFGYLLPLKINFQRKGAERSYLRVGCDWEGSWLLELSNIDLL